jgi:uncharacterized damage-inducible protein DinB
MNAAILTALVVALTQGAAAGPSTADRQAAVRYLEETSQQFLKSIEGVSDAQWKFKGGPDRWSIAEVAEHIALSESTILALITEKVLKGPVVTTKAPLPDEKIKAAITDRTQKAQAPEMLRPTNRWATREALTKDFLAARQKTIDFVKTTDVDLRAHQAEHPALKTIDGYQWILLLAAHSARHTAQIEEVKTTTGYPK